MNMPDQTRNLNPTLEARVAMIIYGRAYSEQRGGSMDFWDKLDDYNKNVCRTVVSFMSEREHLARIDELEGILKAGDGKTWDSQMAGSVGYAANRYLKLKKEE